MTSFMSIGNVSRVTKLLTLAWPHHFTMACGLCMT